MVSPYHYVSDSISFHALNNLLSLSSANVNSFLNDVSIACGVSPFADYLSLFSCNCGPGNIFFKLWMLNIYTILYLYTCLFL